MFQSRRYIFEVGLTAAGSTCAGAILGTIFGETNQGTGATTDQNELAEGVSVKGS